MVLNKRGGKNAKKQSSSGTRTSARSLTIKDKSPESCELYGRVVNRFGGNPPQILVLCEDGVERTCVVRGKMVKRVWMNKGDFVIILYNKESSENKGEIAHKYHDFEVPKLEKMGEINLNKFRAEGEVITADDGIVFETEGQQQENDDNLHQDINPTKKLNIADLDADDDDDIEEDDFNIDDI